MSPGNRHAPVVALLIASAVALSIGVVVAQPAPLGSPVAAMYAEDQKRDASLAQSFLTLDLPASKAATGAARVFLSAGDLERAFDQTTFRPDAAIVPTNTDLTITASLPATQKVLIDRVRKQPDVLRDFEDQIAARRKQSPAPGGKDPGVLRIGTDTFVAQLPRGSAGNASAVPLPRTVCLIATDFAEGGAIDRRELFTQDRLRKGIADCLSTLDRAGARSLVLPLMGAASAKTQTNDAQFEGQRVLKECRLINATAGIALGIHDFAASRSSLREIGIVQWDQEINDMFKVPAGSRAAQSAQTAYRAYAEQVKQAFRKGLAGEATTANDVNGSCNNIFNVR